MNSRDRELSECLGPPWEIAELDLPTPEEAELSGLPPAVGPRYLQFQSSAPQTGSPGTASLAPSDEAMQASAALVVGAAPQITGLPDGLYAFADSVDDDGGGRCDVAIRAMLRVRAGHVEIDLRDSDDQVAGPINSDAGTTRAVINQIFGAMAPLDIHLRPGSIVAALPPSSTSLGALITAQRLRDVLLGAAAQAAPQELPAASAPATVVLLASTAGLQKLQLGGGHGASSMTDGASAELAAIGAHGFFQVVDHRRRAGSGGGGIHPGGEGIELEIEFLGDGKATLLGERHRRPPYGLAGGGPGAVGRHILSRGSRNYLLPGKLCFSVRAGDRLRVETPGGGGHGDAQRAAFFAQLLSS